MSDNTMATVLFISVFVFLFFKFCLGVPAVPALGVMEGEDNLASSAAGDASQADWPLPLVRKCPVGTVYSIAVGDCKDLVRSTKGLSQRLQLLMPYLLAATRGQQQPQQ